MRVQSALLVLVLAVGCRDTLPFEDTDLGTDTDVAETAATVSGSVVLPDGAPADGALLALGTLAAVADADGLFAFDEVEPGSYDLRAELGGYAPATAQVDAVAGENASVTLTLSALQDEAPLISALSGVPLPVPRAGTADLTATTLSEDGLTWEWSVDGEFEVDADGTTAVLTAPDVPSAIAQVVVRATAEDGQSDTAELSVSTAPNAVPVIESLVAVPIAVEPGGVVDVSVEASDADDVEFIYEWTVPSGWGSEGEGAAITLTAPDSYGSQAVVEVVVTDPWGDSARRTTTVSTLANDGPVISSVTANPSVVSRAGSSTLQVIALDAQQADLDIEWTGPDGWDIASPSAATTAVTGPDLPADVATFRVTVTDDDGAQATGEVVVQTAGNVAPEIVGINALPNPAEPGQTLNLSFNATDAEGDALSASWQAPAEWGMVDQGATATLVAPDARGVSASVVLTVTDAYGAQAQSSVAVATTGNLNPVIASVTALPSQLEPGGQTTVRVDATDPNGDALEVTWVVPVGWGQSGSGAAIQLTAPDAPGDAVVGVTVSDAYGGQAEGSVVVSVQASNEAPVIEPIDVSTLTLGEVRDLVLNAQDPNGDPLDIQWRIQGGGWSVEGDGLFAALTAPLPSDVLSETATLVVVASDGELESRLTTEVRVVADGASCQALSDAGAPSGAYWLDPDGDLSRAYAAGCDMADDGAWTLMYKRSAGVAVDDVFADATQGNVNPYDLDLMDRDREDRDFASAVLASRWGQFTEARVEVVDGGVVAQYTQYDTAGSTPETFMAKDRLVASSWRDMVPQHVGSALFWGVAGDADTDRRFYINRQWGGCPNDQGWLLVGGGRQGPCSFDSATGILYATGDGVTNFTTGDVAQADALLVWVREAAPGVSRASAVATCADLSDSVTEDTTWWVDPDGDGGAAPFQTFCDVDNGGWTMAYKKTSGVVADPYDTWVNGNVNTNDPDALDRDGHSGDFSTPASTTGWDAFSQARVEVLVDGEAVHTLTFDLTGRSNTQWFARDALTDSTWTDILANPQNYFSVAGHPEIERHFFLNRNYGGCAADAGWLVVTGTRSSYCSWEDGVEVLYSVPNTFQNYTTGNVARADAMAIFLR